MELFTAVGFLEKGDGGLPVVMSNGREYALSAHELMLWARLVNVICTEDECKTAFVEITNDVYGAEQSVTFDDVMKRLRLRGLVISGYSNRENTTDVLFFLLQKVELVAIKPPLRLAIHAFLDLLFKEGFKTAKRVFQRPDMTFDEKFVYHFIGNERRTLEYILMGVHKKIHKAGDNKAGTARARYLLNKDDIIIAVTQLYIKKMIFFDKKVDSEHETHF